MRIAVVVKVSQLVRLVSTVMAMHVAAFAYAQVDACAVLTPAEIKKITGRTDLATGKPDLTQLKTGTECQHSGKHDIGVYVRPNSKQFFAQLRDHEKTYKGYTQEPVSGVGDEAYYMIDKRYVSLNSRVGDKSVRVSMELDGAPVDGHKSMVLALTKAAAAKLR
jgi:hypothetical protein